MIEKAEVVGHSVAIRIVQAYAVPIVQTDAVEYRIANGRAEINAIYRIFRAGVIRYSVVTGAIEEYAVSVVRAVVIGQDVVFSRRNIEDYPAKKII